jgi:ATPase subunit of ABC transporter with duplicated ATPase domains
MLFLNISDLYFSHKQKLIFSKVNLTISRAKKIALIGQNGSGKSTLLDLITDKIRPDRGSLKSQASIEYLEQDVQQDKLGLTIKEFIFSKTNNSEDWLTNYALQLSGIIGLNLNYIIANLSGGQKTRIALASLITKIKFSGAEDRTLLLLDEPTNNLDKQGIDWLSSILNSFRGAIIFATHERFLIDRIADTIYLIENKTIEEFNCSYGELQQVLRLRGSEDLNKYHARTKEAKKLNNLIKEKQSQVAKVDKLRFDRKKSGVPKISLNNKRNSVQRANGKIVSSLNTKLSLVEGAEKPNTKPIIDIKFSVSDQPEAKVILKLEEIKKSFGKIKVLDKLNLSLIGNQKVLVNGNNGSGKSTLLKVVAGLVEPDSGSRYIGEGIKIGYFAQDTYHLNFNNKVLNEIDSENYDEAKLISLLLKAGIPIESIQGLVGNLSRGQQAKLGFIKIIASNPNFLILDEPTNHLDIETKEVIEEAIINFNGPILMVSHDKYLTAKLKFDQDLKL